MVDGACVSPIDAVRVALAYLEPELGLGPRILGPETHSNVHRTARRLRSRLIQALYHLEEIAGAITAEILMVAGFDGDGPTGARGGYLGPREPHHGLGVHNHYFGGFHALEPHYTKTLARLLSPADGGCAAVERANSFITALHLAGRQLISPDLTVDCKAAELTSEAEVALTHHQGQGRIDVLLRWIDANDQRHALVVEAKFDAPVRDGTLSAYRAFARRTCGARSRLHLFLVVNRIDPDATRKNRDWRQVTWLSVLRQWERRLAESPQAHSDEFVHFRSALWHRATIR